MKQPVTDLMNTIDAGMTESLRRLFEILRIPSVATDPAYAKESQAAGEWTRDHLAKLGFEAELHKTTGQPAVVASYTPKGLPANALHVLFYGHYDVQPADPLEKWTTPAFEPMIRKNQRGEDCIYARGAEDNKGQFMTFVEAVRALLAAGHVMPFKLTLLIEGDEEGDPSHVDDFLKRSKGWLKPDIAMICDTGRWDRTTPAITISCRGCMAEEFTVKGPRIDLHSGLYGGPVVNPIKVVSRILASMHDKNGRVQIPGFYTGVKAPSPAQRKAWRALKFDERSFLKGVGLTQAVGEKGFSALEQIWVRPTAEVNGMWGGYTGAGTKTVLPAEASAKMTFRLVAGQNPKRIRTALRAFIRKQLPKDCRIAFNADGGEASAVSVSENSPWIDVAKTALKQEWSKDAVLMGEGGSLPVIESFQKHLKTDCLLVGFGLEDSNAHSPDERYPVDTYRKGIRSWVRLLIELSDRIENDHPKRPRRR